MTNTNTTWTYEGYWATVFGSDRDESAVVSEFDLTAPTLDWVCAAEAEAALAGGIDLPTEWDAYRAQASEALDLVAAA